MENKKYSDSRLSGKNESEPMDKITRVMLVVLIGVFIAAVVIIKVFL